MAGGGFDGRAKGDEARLMPFWGGGELGLGAGGETGFGVGLIAFGDTLAFGLGDTAGDGLRVRGAGGALKIVTSFGGDTGFDGIGVTAAVKVRVAGMVGLRSAGGTPGSSILLILTGFRDIDGKSGASDLCKRLRR